MKRGGPLRRTPFKSSSRPIYRTPSSARSSGSKSKIPPKVRAAVEQRAGMLCEVKTTSACEVRGYHCHHVLMRSAGGQHVVENLVLVCETCHRYIHAHPRLAYEMGWLLRRS